MTIYLLVTMLISSFQTVINNFITKAVGNFRFISALM